MKKEIRSFATVEFPDKQEDNQDLFSDPVAVYIENLGIEAKGNKVNDLIPVMSIYPNMDPDCAYYPVSNEKNFWLMAEDATAILIDKADSKIRTLVIYEPVYNCYPTKYYTYQFDDSSKLDLLKKLICELETPILFKDGKQFNDLSPILLKLAEIKQCRIESRLFQPSESEINILKMKDNCDKLKYAIELIWIPRKEKGLVKHLLAYNPSSCILCQSINDVRPVGTIMGYADVPIGIIYHICEKCVDELAEKSIFEKVIKNISNDVSNFRETKFEYPDHTEYFGMIKNKIKENGFEPSYLIKEDRNELHISFKNNTKLIISYKNMLNYAYVFLIAGKETRKWDSRDDHGLPTGTDHFHFDPRDYNKNVKSSYLIGNFLLDCGIVFDEIKSFIE